MNKTATICQELLKKTKDIDSVDLSIIRDVVQKVGTDLNEPVKSIRSTTRGVTDVQCSIRFYKIRNTLGYTTPKEFFTGQRWVYLRERSIRTVGDCCWQVIR